MLLFPFLCPRTSSRAFFSTPDGEGQNLSLLFQYSYTLLLMRLNPEHRVIDACPLGVPQKSPDHYDVNTSSISTQTRREARSPKTKEDVWHYTYPRRRLGWLSRSGYADACTDIEQVLHIHIATVLSSAIWLVDQSGKGLAASPKPSPELAAVVAHLCVEKGSSRCMCFGARYLLGALSFLLFISL